MTRHVVRSALGPVATVVGQEMGGLLGGSVLIEYVFNWPGLKTPQDLKSVPALAIRRDLVEWNLRNRDGVTATAHPKVEFAANRQTILVDAAIAGLGIANLPTCMVEDALAAGTLVRALPAWEPLPIEMTALWQRDRITSRLWSK